MRKKHQAILITTEAKKNIYNDMSNYNNDYEQKEQLQEFFNKNINPEDVEYTEKEILQKEENDFFSDDDEDSVDFSNIKVSKGTNNTKQDPSMNISEKAVFVHNEVSKCDTIELNVEKLEELSKKDDKDKTPENSVEIGNEINFSDIIQQIIFWKGNEQINIDGFELLNLNYDKMKDVIKDFSELKNLAKRYKLDGKDSLIKQMLMELFGIYTKQKQGLNYLQNNLDKLNKISFGKNCCKVNYKPDSSGIKETTSKTMGGKKKK